jgi:hypothetical protein
MVNNRRYKVKKQAFIDWQYVFGLVILPFFLLALAYLISLIQGVVRYNPDYFTQEYLDRYAVKRDLLNDLEAAINQGDGLLLAEVQGSRSVPQNLEPLPNVHFSIYWDRDNKYADYLYMDTQNYHRYMQYLRWVRGRYVRVPEGLYYYMDSGNWIHFFGPLYAVWLLIVALFTLGAWIYRWMAVVRKEMYDTRPGQFK